MIESSNRFKLNLKSGKLWIEIGKKYCPSGEYEMFAGLGGFD